MTKKYGFIYIWFDKKHKRYYIGSHWGTTEDGYICSSNWMRDAYKKRPGDFKRRIIEVVACDRQKLYEREGYWISLIDETRMSKNNKKDRSKVRYYNLNNTVNHNIWWLDKDAKLTIGEKISKAKKGKSVPCSAEKAKNISEAKKSAFVKKREIIGSSYSAETIEKHRQNKIGKTYSDEVKVARSEKMKEWWSNQPEERRYVAPETMSKKEQSELCGSRMKRLWADPVWAANQRAKLKEGAKNRPPRSEESKKKASIAQKGIPKPRRVNA